MLWTLVSAFYAESDRDTSAWDWQLAIDLQFQEQPVDAIVPNQMYLSQSIPSRFTSKFSARVLSLRL